jgi:hypothetical protein
VALEFRPMLWTNEGDGIVEVHLRYDTALTRPPVRAVRAINRSPRTYRFRIWRAGTPVTSPPDEDLHLPPTDDAGFTGNVANNRYFMVQTLDPDGLPDGGYAPDGWTWVYEPVQA